MDFSKGEPLPAQRVSRQRPSPGSLHRCEHGSRGGSRALCVRVFESERGEGAAGGGQEKPLCLNWKFKQFLCAQPLRPPSSRPCRPRMAGVALVAAEGREGASALGGDVPGCLPYGGEGGTAPALLRPLPSSPPLTPTPLLRAQQPPGSLHPPPSALAASGPRTPSAALPSSARLLLSTHEGSPAPRPAGSPRRAPRRPLEVPGDGGPRLCRLRHRPGPAGQEGWFPASRGCARGLGRASRVEGAPRGGHTGAA